MKLIIAVIQPDKLEAVQEALSSVEVFRLTVWKFGATAVSSGTPKFTGDMNIRCSC